MPADGKGAPAPPAAVLVVPLGGFSAGGARALAAEISRRVAIPCRAGPAPADLEAPRLPGRAQVDADLLLGRLEAVPAPGGTLLVGATLQDIGNPVFAFFFGRARRGGRAALVSLARLRPPAYGLPDDHALTLRRAAMEAVHEIGHLAGLPHCPQPRCVMRFAPSVEAADLRGGGFCPSCAGGLPPHLRPSARPGP